MRLSRLRRRERLRNVTNGAHLLCVIILRTSDDIDNAQSPTISIIVPRDATHQLKTEWHGHYLQCITAALHASLILSAGRPNWNCIDTLYRYALFSCTAAENKQKNSAVTEKGRRFTLFKNVGTHKKPQKLTQLLLYQCSLLVVFITLFDFVNLYFTISMVVTIIKTNLTRKQT